jgi:TolB-like protein
MISRTPPRLLCAALLLPAALHAQATSPSSAPRTTAPSRSTVAVLAFDNNTGSSSYDQLGRGMAAMMTTDLAGVPAIRLLERERLADVTKELDAQRSRYFDSTTAVAVGRLAGAQFIITGSLTAVDPQIRIDTRVIKVESGAIVKATKVSGAADDFFALQKKLTKQLVRDLDVALSPEAEAALDARMAANRIGDLESAVKVSNAMQLADAGDYGSATLEIAPVVAKYPNSTFVKLTADEISRRSKLAAESKSKAAVRDGINSGVKKGISGLLKKKKPPVH